MRHCTVITDTEYRILLGPTRMRGFLTNWLLGGSLAMWCLLRHHRLGFTWRFGGYHAYTRAEVRRCLRQIWRDQRRRRS